MIVHAIYGSVVLYGLRRCRCGRICRCVLDSGKLLVTSSIAVYCTKSALLQWGGGTSVWCTRWWRL